MKKPANVLRVLRVMCWVWIGWLCAIAGTNTYGKTLMWQRHQAMMLGSKMRHLPDKGFTIVELLVAIAVIGILVAIVLPIMLGQVNKARLAEAKAVISAINHAQQAFFLEKGRFASDLSTLAIQIQPSSVYRYGMRQFLSEAIAVARPSDRSLRGVGGRVWVVRDLQGRVLTRSLLCEGRVGRVPFMRRRRRC